MTINNIIIIPLIKAVKIKVPLKLFVVNQAVTYLKNQAEKAKPKLVKAEKLPITIGYVVAAVKLDNKKGTVIKIIAPPVPIKKAPIALAAKVWILINKLAPIKMEPKPPARR